MKEKILFIAGGPWQKPFVEYLKNKNHYIYIVNPKKTPTTDIADYHIKCDINDLQVIDNYIEKIKPSFITSDQSDVATLTVSLLSKKWNLPCNDIYSIEKLTNKYLIYEFAKEININVPETELVNSTKDIENFSNKVKFPIIIKPIDSTNSRGFRKLNKHEDVNDELFQHTKQFSKNKQVIAQKFINGYMITLDGICSNSKHKTIVGGMKKSYYKPGINTNIEYPLNLENVLYKKIIKTNDEYVEKSGMEFGLTHSEYIVENDNFYLIEIGARGGGAGITDKIIPWVSGLNVYDIVYSSIKGNKLDVKELNIKEKYALLKYYEESEVLNFTIKKENEIKKIKGVADFQFNFLSKQFISDTQDCRHSLGIYLANCNNELKEITDKVEKILTATL